MQAIADGSDKANASLLSRSPRPQEGYQLEWDNQYYNSILLKLGILFIMEKIKYYFFFPQGNTPLT